MGRVFFVCTAFFAFAGAMAGHAGFDPFARPVAPDDDLPGQTSWVVTQQLFPPVETPLGLPPPTEIVVRGGLDLAQVNAVFEAKRGSLDACRKQGEDVPAKIELALVVSADGEVTDAGTRSWLEIPYLSRCLAATTRGWTFPKPKTGWAVVETSFVFAALP